MTKNYIGKGYVNYMTPSIEEPHHTSIVIVLADVLASAIAITAAIEIVINYTVVVSIINAVISMLH